MYSEKATGLGFFALIPALIGAAASVGGAAVAAKISKPKEPDYTAIARAQEEDSKKNAIWIGAGGVLLIFILAAMRR